MPPLDLGGEMPDGPGAVAPALTYGWGPPERACRPLDKNVRHKAPPWRVGTTPAARRLRPRGAGGDADWTDNPRASGAVQDAAWTAIKRAG